MPYKIDLVQVRKLTVYCRADDYEGAEEWFQKHKDVILDHLNLEHIQDFNHDVYCSTLYGIIEDKSVDTLFDLLHGEQPEPEKQMEAVYTVLKQETKEDSDDGTPN